MKIAIDINELTLKQHAGVKVYTREIVKALGEIDKENEYILYANCKDAALSRLYNFGNYGNFKLGAVKSAFPFWTYTELPRKINKDKPDILFMPIQTTPFFKKPKNIKIVATVHDLAFLLFPEDFTPKDRFFLNFHTKKAVQMADRIIAPSEATKKDLIKFYNVEENKIKVIYHGVETRHCLVSTTTNPYILFVGTIQPRKNLICLIEAFEKIKNTMLRSEKKSGTEAGSRYACSLRLVICGGKGWMADKICKRARKSEFSKDIIFTGGVSDDELARIYKNALIFVLPSLYEGFGLPVLEAMSYGVPCVVSDNSSLLEIADDHALLVNAFSSDDIAEKISMFLTNEALRKDFSQRGIKNAEKFSWIESARKTLNIFKKTVSADFH